jgi:ribosome-binding protein aMBF1 (putative translation factor)
MTKKFAELEDKMSPESRARSDAIYRQLLTEVPLAELRRARGLSQKALAGVLHVDQASISKLERRADMYISTLRSHIEAMGGELEIVARFPDGAVKIANFTGIESTEDVVV